MKGEKEISDKQFKQDLENLKQDKSKIVNKHKEDNDNLSHAVEELQLNNREKQYLITKLKEEIEDLKTKLELLEVKRNNVKIGSETFTGVDINKPFNLFDELENSAQNIKFVGEFNCKTCEKTFVDMQSMDGHIQKCTKKRYSDHEVVNRERNLFKQRIESKKSIFKLRDKEMIERAKCNCRQGCRIFHFKHNWYKTKSNDFLTTLENLSNGSEEIFETGTRPKLYSCDKCKEIFKSVRDLKIHNKSNHTDTENEVNHKSVLNGFQTEKECTNLVVEENLVGENVSSSVTDKRDVQNLCKICLLSFKTENHLIEHLQKHSTVKVWPSILKNHCY